MNEYESSPAYCEAPICVHCTAAFYCTAGSKKCQSCSSERFNVIKSGPDVCRLNLSHLGCSYTNTWIGPINVDTTVVKGLTQIFVDKSLAELVYRCNEY